MHTVFLSLFVLLVSINLWTNCMGPGTNTVETPHHAHCLLVLVCVALLGCCCYYGYYFDAIQWLRTIILCNPVRGTSSPRAIVAAFHFLKHPLSPLKGTHWLLPSVKGCLGSLFVAPSTNTVETPHHAPYLALFPSASLNQKIQRPPVFQFPKGSPGICKIYKI